MTASASVIPCAREFGRTPCAERLNFIVKYIVAVGEARIGDDKYIARWNSQMITPRPASMCSQTPDANERETIFSMYITNSN